MSVKEERWSILVALGVIPLRQSALCCANEQPLHLVARQTLAVGSDNGTARVAVYIDRKSDDNSS